MQSIVPVNSFTYVQRIDWFSRSEKSKIIHCNFIKLLLHNAFIPYIYKIKNNIKHVQLPTVFLKPFLQNPLMQKKHTKTLMSYQLILTEIYT